MRLILRGLIAFATVGATVAVLALELGYVTPRTDTPGHLALGTLAILGVGQALFEALHEYRLDKSVSFKTGVHDALAQGFRSLIREDGLHPENVAITAWMVQRRLKLPWQKRLVRVGRLRLISHPTPSQIVWTKGKGVLGHAWKVNAVIPADTATSWKGLEGCGRQTWNALDNTVRLHLSYREFQRIQGKYSGVLAVPIAHPTSSHFIGCITVDVRAGEPPSLVHTQSVLDIAASAGTTIANLVQMVPRWVYTNGG